MSRLYWSCSDNFEDELLHLLAEKGRAANILGTGNRLSVIEVANPDAAALYLTVDLLSRERIKSAALTSAPLPEEDFWIAAEWWHGIVVEKSEGPRMEAISELAQLQSEYPERGLLVFGLRKKAAPPPQERESQAEGDHFAADVRMDPRNYYGEFADPLTGGASVLYAAGIEAARARGLPAGRIVIGSPEELGFTVDDGECSVVAWRRNSVIAVEAVGFSLGSDRELAGLFGEHNVELDFTDLQAKTDVWQEQGYRFGVGLVLRGLEDPPVIIPVGSVYQQPTLGSSMQNLAVAQAASPMVAAGATVPLILPAWCLNPSFSAPSGPVAPTPLIAASAGGTQEMVWNDIRRRYQAPS